MMVLCCEATHLFGSIVEQIRLLAAGRPALSRPIRRFPHGTV